MGTTTLTIAVLMIIRVIWFRANGIDTKAHDWLTGEWGVGSGGNEGDEEDGGITNDASRLKSGNPPTALAPQCPMPHAQSS
ncbi:MAG: hypothetical protein V7L29_09720 [Nostoc sp.]|uniref:hypothetical protein n=1 Tax=Nostoc sp. TaxID=1180 RepID=UPI002FF3C7C5